MLSFKIMNTQATVHSVIAYCHQARPSKKHKSRESTISGLRILQNLAPKILISLIAIFLTSASCVVVHQVRFIASKNGRTDYALVGESIELSCHYIMKDDAEDIKQLIWSKDGKNFLRWRKNKPGLEVLSYTFKGHIDPNSKHSHITIHNVTIGMHGKYNCSVKTDLGSHSVEHDLVVISRDNCKSSDWLVSSERSSCKETFKLDCRFMFPRPVPSCGLWNGKLDRFIRSVTVDISEESSMNNKEITTYRVRYTGKFQLPDINALYESKSNKSFSLPRHANQNADLLQFAGGLIFKCDIVVPETSWRLSLSHKMFDHHDGCDQDPLETIERMRINYSHYATARMRQAGYLASKQIDDFEMLSSNLKYDIRPAPDGKSNEVSLNCWHKPKFGSIARLSCATDTKHVKLVGANQLECSPEGWVPIIGKTESESRLLAASHKENLKSSSNVRSNELSRRHEPLTHPKEEEVSADTNTLYREFDTMIGTEAAPSSQVDLIPTTEEVVTFDTQKQAHRTKWNSSLSPSQLANLLPSCISTRRMPSVSSNRLPLLEDARILESHSAANPQSNNNHRSQNSRQSHKSIFNFSTSGSKSQYKLFHKIMQLSLVFVISIGLQLFKLNDLHSF